MKKKTPEFKNEDAERKFWTNADSTKYLDWQSGKRKKLVQLRPRHLAAVRLSEGNIESSTENGLSRSQFGARAPLMIELLDKAIERLTEVASCKHGCRGQDHTVENLVRRLVNLSLAALKLSKVGYYDEALLLVRSGAEVANLLQLFSLSRDVHTRWRTNSEEREFRPVQVRLAIEKSGSQPFTSASHYKALSARAAHTTHEFALTSHGEGGHVGPWLAVPGFLLTLAETFEIVRSCISIVGALTDQPSEVQSELSALFEEMAKERSPITVENYVTALRATLESS